MPEVVEQSKKIEKPWKVLGCCVRCYKAMSDKKKCRCRCHGQHHGLGKKKAEEGVQREISSS